MKSNDIKRSSAHTTWIRILCMTALLSLTGIPLALGAAANDVRAETSPPPGAYILLADKGEIEFPFEIFRGDIRFECEVNGHQVHMLLDDGFMWDQLLFWGGPVVDSLDLVYDGEMAIGDEDSEQLVSRTASGIRVRFPGVEFTEQTAVVTPGSSGVSRMWSGSAGQISATFFKHLVVDINFDKMIITLRKPESFEYDGNGVAIPWQPLGFGPWSIPATLQLEDGRNITMKLLMDLGYNDQLQLVVGGKHNITLPEKKLPTSLGFNMQREETRGFIGRIPQVYIGGYRVNDLVAGFVSEEHSDHAVYEAMIGLNLLSRFNLVFDYNRQRLFVEPNNSFKTPFEFNMSGLVMRPALGGHSIIEMVYEHSPAADAGLQLGDKILKIDGREITDYDFFELLSKFKQEGAEVNLLIERNGKEKEVSLVLRRVI